MGLADAGSYTFKGHFTKAPFCRDRSSLPVGFYYLNTRIADISGRSTLQIFFGPLRHRSRCTTSVLQRPWESFWRSWFHRVGCCFAWSHNARNGWAERATDVNIILTLLVHPFAFDLHLFEVLVTSQKVAYQIFAFFLKDGQLIAVPLPHPWTSSLKVGPAARYWQVLDFVEHVWSWGGNPSHERSQSN